MAYFESGAEVMASPSASRQNGMATGDAHDQRAWEPNTYQSHRINTAENDGITTAYSSLSSHRPDSPSHDLGFKSEEDDASPTSSMGSFEGGAAWPAHNTWRNYTTNDNPPPPPPTHPHPSFLSGSLITHRRSNQPLPDYQDAFAPSSATSATFPQHVYDPPRAPWTDPLRGSAEFAPSHSPTDSMSSSGAGRPPQHMFGSPATSYSHHSPGTPPVLPAVSLYNQQTAGAYDQGYGPNVSIHGYSAQANGLPYAPYSLPTHGSVLSDRGALLGNYLPSLARLDGGFDGRTGLTAAGSKLLGGAGRALVFAASLPPSNHGLLGRESMSERPFKCDVCIQAFNRNHDLKRHKRIHLTVKPYPCGWCEKAFSRKDALKRHLLVKGCAGSHNVTVEESVAKAEADRKAAAAVDTAAEAGSSRSGSALSSSSQSGLLTNDTSIPSPPSLSRVPSTQSLCGPSGRSPSQVLLHKSHSAADVRYHPYAAVSPSSGANLGLNRPPPVRLHPVPSLPPPGPSTTALPMISSYAASSLTSLTNTTTAVRQQQPTFTAVFGA